jgi:hypothetical protein
VKLRLQLHLAFMRYDRMKLHASLRLETSPLCPARRNPLLPAQSAHIPLRLRRRRPPPPAQPRSPPPHPPPARPRPSLPATLVVDMHYFTVCLPLFMLVPVMAQVVPS